MFLANQRSQASVAFVVIFFHSLSPFRHAFYEFFLHSHIVLVTASFVGLWHHLEHFVHRWIFLAALAAWGIDVSRQTPNPSIFALCLTAPFIEIIPTRHRDMEKLRESSNQSHHSTPSRRRCPRRCICCASRKV